MLVGYGTREGGGQALDGGRRPNGWMDGAELDDQSNYYAEVKRKLSFISVTEKKTVLHEDYNLKLPDIKCDSFSGEGTSHLEFHSFITQFNNIVGFRDNLSKCTKLIYLKSYLKGYALKLISHLQIILV